MREMIQLGREYYAYHQDLQQEVCLLNHHHCYLLTPMVPFQGQQQRDYFLVGRVKGSLTEGQGSKLSLYSSAPIFNK